jgi:hypothetical protein
MTLEQLQKFNDEQSAFVDQARAHLHEKREDWDLPQEAYNAALGAALLTWVVLGGGMVIAALVGLLLATPEAKP